jgi:hypothetical protein
MSRQDRLKECSNPMHGPQGAGRDQANIDAWSDRATANSQIAPRASSGKMKLPSTGKAMATRDTSMKPYRARGDARAAAKADKNFAGDSSYLPGLRRNA